EGAKDTICTPRPELSTYLDVLGLVGVSKLDVLVHRDLLQDGDPRPALAQTLFGEHPAYENGPLAVYEAVTHAPPTGLFGAVEDTEDWYPVEPGPSRWTDQR